MTEDRWPHHEVDINACIERSNIVTCTRCGDTFDLGSDFDVLGLKEGICTRPTQPEYKNVQGLTDPKPVYIRVR